MSSYYVDIHVIQSVPPSNVNRDDTCLLYTSDAADE